MTSEIYIVVKVGPEWRIPIEAHLSKEDAKLHCKSLDAQLGEGAMDRLSGHEVIEIPLNH